MGRVHEGGLTWVLGESDVGTRLVVRAHIKYGRSTNSGYILASCEWFRADWLRAEVDR